MSKSRKGKNSRPWRVKKHAGNVIKGDLDNIKKT